MKMRRLRMTRLLISALAMTMLVAYFLTFSGIRVRSTSDGRIQVVSSLYPICPKVYAEGTAIDTLEVATAYSTFAEWFYHVQTSTVYAVRDTLQYTTIVSTEGTTMMRGRSMSIEQYSGPHGEISLFTYFDDDGNRVSRDFYGGNPDDKNYAVRIFDSADYITEPYNY